MLPKDLLKYLEKVEFSPEMLSPRKKYFGGEPAMNQAGPPSAFDQLQMMRNANGSFTAPNISAYTMGSMFNQIRGMLA